MAAQPHGDADDEVINAAFRRVGVLRVDTIDEKHSPFAEYRLSVSLDPEPGLFLILVMEYLHKADR